MSADPDSSKMNLEVLFGNLADSIEKASSEDLLAEAKSAGQDTERIAADVKNTLLKAVRGFEQIKLHAARSSYRTRSTARLTRRFVMPSTPAARLQLLMNAALEDSRVARVTAKYRNLSEHSDEDVQSALEDLSELGAFDDIEERIDHGDD